MFSFTFIAYKKLQAHIADPIKKAEDSNCVSRMFGLFHLIYKLGNVNVS